MDRLLTLYHPRDRLLKRLSLHKQARLSLLNQAARGSIQDYSSTYGIDIDYLQLCVGESLSISAVNKCLKSSLFANKRARSIKMPCYIKDEYERKMSDFYPLDKYYPKVKILKLSLMVNHPSCLWNEFEEEKLNYFKTVLPELRHLERIELIANTWEDVKDIVCKLVKLASLKHIDLSFIGDGSLKDLLQKLEKSSDLASKFRSKLRGLSLGRSGCQIKKKHQLQLLKLRIQHKFYRNDELYSMLSVCSSSLKFLNLCPKDSDSGGKYEINRILGSCPQLEELQVRGQLGLPSYSSWADEDNTADEHVFPLRKLVFIKFSERDPSPFAEDDQKMIDWLNLHCRHLSTIRVSTDHHITSIPSQHREDEKEATQFDAVYDACDKMLDIFTKIHSVKTAWLLPGPDWHGAHKSHMSDDEKSRLDREWAMRRFEHDPKLSKIICESHHVYGGPPKPLKVFKRPSQYSQPETESPPLHPPPTANSDAREDQFLPRNVPHFMYL